MPVTYRKHRIIFHPQLGLWHVQCSITAWTFTARAACAYIDALHGLNSLQPCVETV